jgi:hypothetical protein
MPKLKISYLVGAPMKAGKICPNHHAADPLGELAARWLTQRCDTKGA